MHEHKEWDILDTDVWARIGDENGGERRQSLPFVLQVSLVFDSANVEQVSGEHFEQGNQQCDFLPFSSCGHGKTSLTTAEWTFFVAQVMSYICNKDCLVSRLWVVVMREK